MPYLRTGSDTMKRLKTFLVWPISAGRTGIERFQKRRALRAYTATVKLKPGVTTIRLTVEGRVYADLILDEITVDFYNGTSARFVDRSRFMTGRRVQ
jgi:hypothetical protein